jgi:hypothetical protein
VALQIHKLPRLDAEIAWRCGLELLHYDFKEFKNAAMSGISPNARSRTVSASARVASLSGAKEAAD